MRPPCATRGLRAAAECRGQVAGALIQRKRGGRAAARYGRSPPSFTLARATLPPGLRCRLDPSSGGSRADGSRKAPRNPPRAACGSLPPPASTMAAGGAVRVRRPGSGDPSPPRHGRRRRIAILRHPAESGSVRALPNRDAGSGDGTPPPCPRRAAARRRGPPGLLSFRSCRRSDPSGSPGASPAHSRSRGPRAPAARRQAAGKPVPAQGSGPRRGL